jgi:hypothetical protein
VRRFGRRLVSTGRLAMKLRWIDTKGISGNDLAELPALQAPTDGISLARHS